MAKRKTSDERNDIPVTRGSGNVFADLGMSNPEERLAKAQLASLIDDVIRERALTQQDAVLEPLSATGKTSSVIVQQLSPFQSRPPNPWADAST